MQDLARRLAVARGDEPADLVVRGGRVFSVFTREWLEADVAIVDGVIAGVGRVPRVARRIDAAGRYVVPGFIDAHMHIESTKLLPDEFARLVLPLGTTAVVADPHEIANVLGTDGVHWLLDASRGPASSRSSSWRSSCVPASRVRVAAAAARASATSRRSCAASACSALAEMMNFPGVIAGDAAELAKLALEGAQHVDGHAPGVLGNGARRRTPPPGIRSDHETLTVEEGRERLRAGIWLLIREASMARNLQALLAARARVRPGAGSRSAPTTATPRTSPTTATSNGMVRDAVAAGIDPADAILMASFHPAALARARPTTARSRPGYVADLLLLPDLETFVPGARAQARPTASTRCRTAEVPEWVRHTVRLKPVTAADFAIPWEGGSAPRDRADHGPGRDRVARGRPARRRRRTSSPTRNATSSSSPSSSATSRRGASASGSSPGSGLRRGALASTVAHDAHNLVVVGADDEDMARRVQAARRGRRRHRRRRRRPRRRGVPAAGRGPALRPAARRSSSRRAAACNDAAQRARLGRARRRS